MNINKEILRLAIPNILSNISIPLISSVDTALMGHLSLDHLGAVGIGAMIFNFIYWNFGFLRMGTTGLTAQNLGRDESGAITLILIRTLSISLIISAFLLAFYLPISWMSINLLNVVPAQENLVLEYFNIRILAAPATLSLYVLMGWYFGMQNAIYPLVITIFVNGLNLALSYYFVIHLHWDISGVAYGTVIAQYSGFVLALVLLYRKYKKYVYFKLDEIKGTINEWMDLISINANLFIRTMGLTFAFAFFYSQSSKQGALVLATNVVLLQFLNWMSYGIDGFAFASESLVGKYYGAGNKAKMNRAIVWTFIWGFILAITYALLYYIFGDAIIGLFTKDMKVIESASSNIVWVVALPLVAFVCYVWDGIFIGLTAADLMRNSMIISIGVYLGFYYISASLNYENIWFSLMIFLVARGIIQTIYWFYNKKLIGIINAVY